MLLLFFIGVLFEVGLDQLTKVVASGPLQQAGTVPLIPDVFHLTYLENRGAAFGILQDQRWLFAIITVAVVIGVIVFLIRKRPENKMLVVSLTLLTGGAIGNLIDRLARGYVVDLFDFRLINFPIFNVADIFVVVGAFLLAAYLIFIEGKKEKQK